LDLEQLGAVAGADTLAVMAVHLYGVSEDIPAIKKLSEKMGFLRAGGRSPGFRELQP
jgi:dTDP-4-amino-4,6-dideoxygalactose transaminase